MDGTMTASACRVAWAGWLACVTIGPVWGASGTAINDVGNRTTCRWQAARDAVVRIRRATGVGSSSVGTGTVFRVSERYAYVLTNAHVAGTRPGGDVALDFWCRGHQSIAVSGRVVWTAYRPTRRRDIAVVRIDLADLGGYRPPSVPIADDDVGVASGTVVTIGCGGGRWPSSMRGFVVNDDGTRHDTRAVRFVPMPAGGRSGSALLDDVDGGLRIVGLVAWRSTDAGGHSLDGRDESHGVGIAMTHREIRAAMRGEPAGTVSDVTLTPLSVETATVADSPGAVVDSLGAVVDPLGAAAGCPGGTCPPRRSPGRDGTGSREGLGGREGFGGRLFPSLPPEGDDNSTGRGPLRRFLPDDRDRDDDGGPDNADPTHRRPLFRRGPGLLSPLRWLPRFDVGSSIGWAIAGLLATAMTGRVAKQRLRRLLVEWVVEPETTSPKSPAKPRASRRTSDRPSKPKPSRR